MKKGIAAFNAPSQEFAEGIWPVDLNSKDTQCQNIATADDPAPPSDDLKVAIFIKAAERYRTRLLSAARRIAPSHEDAEDMVQEALLKAFRKLSQFRNESRMETWLYKITQNSAHEYMRRHRKNQNDVSLLLSRNEDEPPIVWDIPDPAKDPEERCLLSEMQAILLRGVEELGPKCKHAFVLCIIDEVPQRTAAKRLKAKLPAVKARIFHGKQKLKRVIRSSRGAGLRENECIRS